MKIDRRSIFNIVFITVGIVPLWMGETHSVTLTLEGHDAGYFYGRPHRAEGMYDIYSSGLDKKERVVPVPWENLNVLANENQQIMRTADLIKAEYELFQNAKRKGKIPKEEQFNIIAYSSGAALTINVLERLRGKVKVDNLITLAPYVAGINQSAKRDVSNVRNWINIHGGLGQISLNNTRLKVKNYNVEMDGFDHTRIGSSDRCITTTVSSFILGARRGDTKPAWEDPTCTRADLKITQESESRQTRKVSAKEKQSKGQPNKCPETKGTESASKTYQEWKQSIEKHIPVGRRLGC